MNKEFNKGLLLAGFGSFWWGFFGVIYFKYIAYIGHIELVVHRCLWTAFTLILTTFFFSKWNVFFKIVKNKLNLFYLFISGFLFFIILKKILHLEKRKVVIINVKVVHRHLCMTNSMWPINAMYLK